MNDRGIRLSPKHGVNPSVTVCPICYEDVGVALFGLIKGSGDAEAPRRTLDPNPCNKCVEHMKIGIILIGVDEDKSDTKPHRTGHFVVVKDDLIKRIVQPDDLREAILKQRVTYIDYRIIEQLQEQHEKAEAKDA